jgi:formylglycine-generating enzyme required for sulfatase activity
VTFDDYDRYCAAAGATEPKADWGRGKMPLTNVSCDDAQAYCAWLSGQNGHAYRLPSEAEWEYACRAGTSTPFHFGARISTDQANFDGNTTYNGSAKGTYRKKTTSVGSFPANSFGLYDMHGNVWEWCQDAWHDNYRGAPEDGSVWEGQDDVSRVLRGGSWGRDPRHCRAASRGRLAPGARINNFGFRLYCSSPIE